MPAPAATGSAEINLVSRLDNAGSLHQSVTSDLKNSKISILPGHEPDFSACTFCLHEEDHTLGNALRWMIMKDPNVEFCGYSAPHPSEEKIHIRVQMYDNNSAVDCLRKALANLRDLFTAISDKYQTSLSRDSYSRAEEITVRKSVADTIRSKGFDVVDLAEVRRKEAEAAKRKAEAGSTEDVEMDD